MAGIFDFLFNTLAARMVNKTLDNSDNGNQVTTLSGNPDEFVKVIWPLALRAQAATGVRAELIMAQGALESAWGAKAISNNLFGIKADSNWTGAKVMKKTREVINGRSVFIDDYFRAYPTIADSVIDHARFLKENKRYNGVFQTQNPVEQAQKVAAAGYSTDPKNYFPKVVQMMQSVAKRVQKFKLPTSSEITSSQN